MVDLDVFQLDGADDITCAGFLDFLAVAAAADEHLADALFALVAGVDDILALGELAVKDAEVADFAEILVLGALEAECHSRIGSIALQLFAAFGLLGLGHLIRCRHVLADELKQTVDTEILLGAGAEDGEEVALVDGEFEGFGELLGSEVAVLEVFLHEGVVGSGGFLNESHTHLGSLVGMSGRDFFLGHLAIGEGVHLVGHDIDHLIETKTSVGGELQHGAFSAEVILQLVHAIVEVGFFCIKVVYYKYHRGVELGSVTVGYLCAHLNATLCIDHNDGGLHHVERGIEFSLIVSEARHIEDVHLLATELGVHQGVLHGIAAVVFNVAVVTDGVLAIDGSAAIDKSATEGHSFGHSGLARFGTAHQGDVANVRSLIDFHCVYVLFILFVCTSWGNRTLI